MLKIQCLKAISYQLVKLYNQENARKIVVDIV